MLETIEKKGLSYSDAGVDINAGNALIERIKPAVKRTHRPGVLGGIGGFGGLFEIPMDRYKQPVLVSGTDGVGTKLKLAIDMKQYDSIGIDLVAMCVNDIIVSGAEPLFFLDYLATGQLDVDTATQIIEGIANGCEQAGAALIGGETAEMPGIYQGTDFDLAGFAVGIVEKEQMLVQKNVQASDALIGINSSGPHSNGYSLIRKILKQSGDTIGTPFNGQSLGEVLLAPTRIYVKSLLSVLAKVSVHALSHITGGGLLENLPRVLPRGLIARIDTNSWQHAEVFDWLQKSGAVSSNEMYRTFNCGIGMVVVVAETDAQTVIDTLFNSGEKAQVIGSVIASNNRQDEATVILK